MEQNLVAVYYLEHVLGLSGITPGHVLAAYKERHWREPGNISNSLRVTARKRNWLLTSDSSAIRTTPQGRNWVDHSMPTRASKK